MKTLLVFPPASDPAHPPLGIASLAGYLREKGEVVELMDLNVRSYHYLLSRENMERCRDKIDGRLAELESRDTLSARDAEEYRLLAHNSMSAEYLICSIGGAFNGLRQPAAYASHGSYRQVASIVTRAMGFVSAAHYPVRWDPRGFSMSYLPTRSSDILRAVSDERENLFLQFFMEQLPRIEKIRPDIIGISVNYYCQLIPALTLAALSKKRLDCPRIVVGGGLICFFQGRWDLLQPFMEDKNKTVDVFVPFEGEVPLFRLIETLKRGGSLSGVPGVVYFDGSAVRMNPPDPPPDLRTLPPPDYEGFPLEEYLAPEPVLLTLTSRGCYWGRCAFCSHAHLYRGRFRQRSVEHVFEEMEQLSRRFGTVHFYFTDESVMPATARNLALAIKSKCRPYRWFGEIRFESTIDAQVVEDMAAGGCAMLMFGLESGEQRLLDLMDKGIRAEHAAEILQWCKAAGIRTFVMFFAGFPSETRQEAETTVRFIEAWREHITQVAFTGYVLEKRSRVYRNARKYGIEEIRPYEGEDLRIHLQYDIGKGLTASEAAAFLDEVKDRPAIQPLIYSHLLSRSHLVFLPLERESDREMNKKTDEEVGVGNETAFDISQPWLLYPKKRDYVTRRLLRFNLDHMRQSLDAKVERGAKPGADDRSSIERSPGHYLFNPETEKLVEVGENGFLLVRLCTGECSLDDILRSLGEQNRQTALDFYRDLAISGFLDLHPAGGCRTLSSSADL